MLKSTLTTLSVLGERIKASDPRRSPWEGTATSVRMWLSSQLLCVRDTAPQWAP